MQGFRLKHSRSRMWCRALLWAGLIVSVEACQSGEGQVPPDEAKLAISVAPLNLEQIGFACYDLEVLAIQSLSPTVVTETVWRRGDFFSNRADEAGAFAGDSDTLCSNVFGNGPAGDILYVGTCDATYTRHVVRLVVDGLYKPSGGRLPEGTDWMNPCPPASPCDFYPDCQVNADTPVTINLTVLRSANQGFFDIGVRFDDIFCSAKVDCSYKNGVDLAGNPIHDPIMLVHGADGEPQNTAVIGFACTAGPGQEDLTELYMNAPRVNCSSAAAPPVQSYYVLPLDIPEGYAWDTVINPPAPGVVFQYGVYYGEEELMCGDEPCQKKYFNVAIGIDPSFTDCVLAFEATAALPGVITQANGWQTPVGSVYPVVVARVNLTPAIVTGPPGAPGVCGENPLNGVNSGVLARYTHGADNQGFPFCYHLDVAGGTVSPHCAPGYDYSDIDANPIFGN